MQQVYIPLQHCLTLPVYLFHVCLLCHSWEEEQTRMCLDASTDAAAVAKAASVAAMTNAASVTNAADTV